MLVPPLIVAGETPVPAAVSDAPDPRSKAGLADTSSVAPAAIEIAELAGKYAGTNWLLIP